MVRSAWQMRLAVWGGATVVLLTSAALSSDRLDPVTPLPSSFVGTLSCTSASCHGAATTGDPGAPLWQQVYGRWLGTAPTFRDQRRDYDPRASLLHHGGDPHALAGQRMLEPRFQAVLERYRRRADGTFDARAHEKCARCHDPRGLVTGGGDRLPAETNHFSTSARESGIGCETCHGGAQGWLAQHYQLGAKRADLQQLGMVDTKHLLTRARGCASCHVGSAENDMNHDMIAAGHPPLRFELASYEALLGPKHWDDEPVRLQQPNYELQLWGAGRVAAAEAMLSLLAARAHQTGPTEVASPPWPEFAESNCQACHQSVEPSLAHSLQEAFRPAARGGGIPPWQTGNRALLDVALGEASAGKLPLDNGLHALQTAMERSLVPAASEIHHLASDARRHLRQLVEQEPNYPLLDARSVLAGLSNTSDTTWEAQCQRLAALVAVRRALQDEQLLSSGDALQIGECERRIAELLRSETSLRLPSAGALREQEFRQLIAELSRIASNQPAPRPRREPEP